VRSPQCETSLDCACALNFHTFDRVTCDSSGGCVDPYVGTGPPYGAMGTVVAGSDGQPPLLVAWDSWFDGHDGNGAENCGFTQDLIGHTNCWYVDCDAVIGLSSNGTSVKQAMPASHTQHNTNVTKPTATSTNVKQLRANLAKSLEEDSIQV